MDSSTLARRKSQGYCPAISEHSIATENSYEEYRVGGIAPDCTLTYSARMDYFLNVPTYRAGADRTVSVPASRLSWFKSRRGWPELKQVIGTIQ